MRTTTLTLLDKREVEVEYCTYGAEPDVGIMQHYFELHSVTLPNSKEQLKLTEAEEAHLLSHIEDSYDGYDD